MPLLVHFVKWTGYMFQQTASYHFNIWNKIISIAININLGAQINCFHKWFHEVGNWVVFQSGLHPQEGSIMSRNISTKACRYCQIHETSVRKLIYVVKFMIGMYGIPHHCSYVHISVIKIMMSSYGLGTCYLEPGVTLSAGAHQDSGLWYDTACRKGKGWWKFHRPVVLKSGKAGEFTRLFDSNI